MGKHTFGRIAGCGLSNNIIEADCSLAIMT